VFGPINNLAFVAIKMGRRQGGPSRTGSKEGAYLNGYVTDPAAANGKTLAVEARQGDLTHIDVIDTATLTRNKVTDGVNDRYPIWEPNSQRLFFVRDRALMSLSIDDKTIAKLETSSRVDQLLTLSKKGDELAVVFRGPDRDVAGQSVVYLLELDRGFKQRAFAVLVGSPLWDALRQNPPSDGRFVDIIGQHQLVIKSANQTNDSGLSICGSPVTAFGGAAWSPDGSQIAVSLPAH
jgi:hypothetical protein